MSDDKKQAITPDNELPPGGERYEKIVKPVDKPVDKSVDNSAVTDEIQPDQDIDVLRRQLEEMKENMDLMRQVLLSANQNQQAGLNVNRQGDIIGEFEKYTLDPANYPDPTPRLADEPRLAPLAFKHNYELDYRVEVSAYETKTGRHIKEPRFHITLSRVVLDDEGNPTDKRYIARKMVFHEDPEAALVIARENGIEVDKSDQRLFLNEMRYLRARDWLFGIFWPKPSDEQAKIREEVIGGQLVQVFTKNSENPGNLPFDKLNSKVRA